MTESREYHIRVQLVNGGLEQLHSGMEELCTFTVGVEADSEEQALAKADGAIFDWAHKHNFYEGQWICNHADRFKGAVPFTLENFFKETGGNLHEKARDARIEAHGTANYLNWRTGLPWPASSSFNQSSILVGSSASISLVPVMIQFTENFAIIHSINC